MGRWILEWSQGAARIFQDARKGGRMIVTDDFLRRDVVKLIKQIDLMIDDLIRRAHALNQKPEYMRDANNSYMMAPLLVAKTQAYATLVQLRPSKGE